MPTKKRKELVPGNFANLGRDIAKIQRGQKLGLPVGRVRFTPISGGQNTEGWLETYPKPTSDQFGGNIAVARDGQEAVIEYQGAQGPVGITFTVMFDDWVNARSIASAWDTFVGMCGEDARDPLAVEWIGQSSTDHDRSWVVAQMDATDEVLIADDNRGTLLRRGATVTLLDATQGVLLDPVKAAKKAAKKKAKPAKAPKRHAVTSRKGDTLMTIAARKPPAGLGNAARWKELDAANGTRDGTQVLPTGTRVLLP